VHSGCTNGIDTGFVALGYAKVAVLGVVQGITELMPVSSTAHMRILPALLGWPDPGSAFSAAMQLAALAAVISYFWRDVWDIVSGSLSAIARRDYYDRSFGLAVGIVIGTIPIGIAGLALAKTLNTCGSPLRSLVVVGLACIVMALLLAIAEVAARHQRPFERVGLLDCDPRAAASRGLDRMRPGRQYRGSWSRVPASSKEATAELSNCQVSRFGRRQFAEIRAASSWAPEGRLPLPILRSVVPSRCIPRPRLKHGRGIYERFRERDAK
jgi:hypothetical protein